MDLPREATAAKEKLLALVGRSSFADAVSPGTIAVADHGVAVVAPELLDEKYELGELIGTGGMGEVWAATHTLLGRRVAIKFLRLDRAGETARIRFLAESRTAARLRHPGIVAVLDVGETPAGVPFHIMEMVDGESLRDVVEREGALPISLAIKMMGEVCDAVTHAHAHGVIHRDIKPQNVIVQRTPFWHCKLIDFGLAKVHELGPEERSLSRVGHVVGSPASISPEQIRGEAVDARTDVYGLGCLAYYALSGRLPHDGETMAEILYRHLFVPPPALRFNGIPRRHARTLRAVVGRALAKEPRARFSAAADFKSALVASENQSRSVDRFVFGGLALGFLVAAGVPLASSSSRAEDPPTMGKLPWNLGSVDRFVWKPPAPKVPSIVRSAPAEPQQPSRVETAPVRSRKTPARAPPDEPEPATSTGSGRLLDPFPGG